MTLHHFVLHWSWTDLDSIHEEATGVELEEISVRTTFWRSFKDQTSEIFFKSEGTLRFLYGTDREVPVLVFNKLLGGLGVELLMLNDSIL